MIGTANEFAKGNSSFAHGRPSYWTHTPKASPSRSRLGSGLLEEWVKHESEGYPNDVELPSYRKIGVPFRGTFSGPFGSGIKNAPIPPYLIEKHAGPNWNLWPMRQSVAAIDELAASARESEGTLRIDASNLILLLQGKVYEDYACNSVWGTISVASLTEIQNAVRNRILELAIQIEKSIPAAADIDVGPPTATAKNPEKVTHQSSNQRERHFHLKCWRRCPVLL